MQKRERYGLNGLNICQATALTIAKAKEFFDGSNSAPMQEEIAGPILEEVTAAVEFSGCGRPRISDFDRLASTLSGGEAQRIQLATSLGSRLVGALYVLDEPSIGLHTRDTARLIRILKSFGIWATRSWLWSTMPTCCALRITCSTWDRERENSAGSCWLRVISRRSKRIRTR